MPKFRLAEGHGDVDLFQIAGGPDSFRVTAGSFVEVPGDIAEETEDAYIVGAGDDARAWPKAMWSIDKPAATAATPKEK